MKLARTLLCLTGLVGWVAIGLSGCATGKQAESGTASVISVGKGKAEPASRDIPEDHPTRQRNPEQAAETPPADNEIPKKDKPRDPEENFKPKGINEDSERKKRDTDTDTKETPSPDKKEDEK
jgi:hypothetical protein